MPEKRFHETIPNKVQEAITNPNIRSYQPKDYPYIDRWMKDLGLFYDGHTEDNKLLDQLVGTEGGDQTGFFTKNKWMFVYEHNGEPAGMLCLNNKRGGSAKIGPVIVNPEVRGLGLGTALLKTAEEAAIAGGTRKLYATTSHLNSHMNHLFTRAGYNIEATFPDQYKRGSNELIWGKHLITPNEVIHTQLRSLLLGETENARRHVKVEPYTEADYEFVQKMNALFQQWHDDLGSDFIEGMIAGHRRGLDFQKKGKVVLIAKRNGEPEGMLTFSPKRGNPVKVYPLVGTPEAQGALVDKAVEIARQNGMHKLYTFTHEADKDQTDFLTRIGFVVRGVLESPYREGHNLYALDLFV